MISNKANKVRLCCVFAVCPLTHVALPSIQDDYYVTSDQMFVPLRWIAPELVDEVHGNLLVADQTLQSNMW